MRLTDWLRANDVSQAELARRVGLTQGRISQICREGTNDARTAQQIVAATGGDVPLAKLLPPLPTAANSDAPAPEPAA